MTISSATYDPATTASQLATAYTAGRQATITTQTASASARASALTKLSSALSDFSSAMATLSGKKTLLANVATFSNTSVGTATATKAATAGNYAFFVEKLATAHQVSYAALDGKTSAIGDKLSIALGAGAAFSVTLTKADSTPKELAAAINAAAGNNAQVTASVMTVNGASQLVLTANATGASQITLDTSAIAAGSTLKTALDLAANRKETVAAQDATIWLGAQGSGTQMTQASNVYTTVDGVTMTFVKAQTAGESPVSLTVGSDTGATSANVQSFVTAFNKLQGVLSSLTDSGEPSKGVAAGAFWNDSGLSSLKSRIASTIRQNIGGVTLAKLGISAARDGTLSVDTTKLTAALASNPDGLDQVFGSSRIGAASGVMGDLSKQLTVWTNSTNGQIQQRQAAVSKSQGELVTRQATLDKQYNSAYQRYLAQFTQLQDLQAQMASNSSVFSSMFSSSDN